MKKTAKKVDNEKKISDKPANCGYIIKSRFVEPAGSVVKYGEKLIKTPKPLGSITVEQAQKLVDMGLAVFGSCVNNEKEK